MDLPVCRVAARLLTMDSFGVRMPGCDDVADVATNHSSGPPQSLVHCPPDEAYKAMPPMPKIPNDALAAEARRAVLHWCHAAAGDNFPDFRLIPLRTARYFSRDTSLFRLGRRVFINNSN